MKKIIFLCFFAMVCLVMEAQQANFWTEINE